MSYSENNPLAQPGARNIAVSGPATADKAGIVEGWKAESGRLRWLTVSAPHFSGDRAPVSSADAERAVINQVACQMDPSKSPKTRLRALMKRNRALDVAAGGVTAAFAGLTVFLVWVSGLLPSQRPAAALCVLALAAWLACIAFGVFHIARSDLLGRLSSRLRNKGGADASAAGASPLEQNMGELVYLLDSNEVDVVVFEGLDTYRYLPLFERLRALNALANARRDGAREPLQFVYFVGDGLLDDPHERAEFFDLIVAAIPFVESADVAGELESGLAEAGIAVDGAFLDELASFVDDPNILRDIVDEARQYKAGLLDGEGGEPGHFERMVALLAYKALFPTDFELLQGGAGYVHALLASRDAIVEALQASNLRESSRLAAEMQAAREAGDEEVAAAAQAGIEAVKRADLELGRMPLSALIGDMEDADAFYAAPPRDDGLTPAQLRSVTENPYFPFLRFAVGSGWIDPTYERYLNNFYSESLSGDDRALIAAIAQGSPADEGRRVRNPFGVVSRLDAEAFSLPSARVFALLRHLLVNGPDDKLKALFAGIGHDGDLAWLVRYAESDSFDADVFEVAEALLDQPIARIVADEDIPARARRRFCHRLLAYGRRALAAEEVRQAVHAFAEEDPRFLAVSRVEPMSIAEGLLDIRYRAVALETEGCDRELLQFVYDRDLYATSAPVIDRLVATLLDTETALDRGFLATRIYSLAGTAVKMNVEREGDLFVETLLEAKPEGLVDSPEAIAWVLGLEDLRADHAVAYLYALSEDISIDRIALVNDVEHQNTLIDRGLVECTPENILDHFVAAGGVVDEHLAALLRDNPFPAGFTMQTAEDHLGSEPGFLKAAIACTELPDEKVAEISDAYRAQFNRFDVEGVSEERCALLIDNGTIRATAANLDFVRRCAPRAAVRFAAVEPKAYLRLALPGPGRTPAECGFSADEALEAFAAEDVDDGVKAALLGEFDSPIALSADFSDELNVAIAARHFDAADLPVSAELYAQGNRKLKRALAEAVAAHADELAASGIALSMEMAADVAWRLRADRFQMVSFIASQLAARPQAPTRLEARDMFERAGLPEYVELIDGPSALVPDTPADDALLAALGALGMAGKQVGRPDAHGLRRVNSKGYSRR